MILNKTKKNIGENKLSHHINAGILYSQCWEDPETGRQSLKITSDDDVLMITSGGCNAINFSLDYPRSITAIDHNQAQNHLLELKIAAIVELDYDAFLGFLGVLSCSKRWSLYRSLRPLLSVSARDYWDLQNKNIEHGVINIGRFDRYINLFRCRIMPLIHTKKQIEQLLSLNDLNEQRRFYDEVWNTWRWRALFRIFFSRFIMERKGRHPDFFKYVDISNIGEHYLQRAHHALTEIPIHDNYFLEYVFTGGFQEAERMPPYLKESNFNLLKSSVQRIQVVSNGLQSFLTNSTQGSFSKFYLSDIFELVPVEEYTKILYQIVSVSRPGARICYYNNLVLRSHPTSLDYTIKSEDDLSQELHWKDRSFVYRRLVVEQIYNHDELNI